MFLKYLELLQILHFNYFSINYQCSNCKAQCSDAIKDKFFVVKDIHPAFYFSPFL